MKAPIDRAIQALKENKSEWMRISHGNPVQMLRKKRQHEDVVTTLTEVKQAVRNRDRERLDNLSSSDLLGHDW